MWLKMKNFNIGGSLKNPIFSGEGSKKPIYSGELPKERWFGPFADLRVGLAKKQEVVFLRGERGLTN